MSEMEFYSELTVYNPSDEILEKYPMLKLLRDIIDKYPGVTVRAKLNGLKTDNGLNVLTGYFINFGDYELSVQFGYGTYRTGGKKEFPKLSGLKQDEYLKDAIDAEIAVIGKYGLIQIDEWHDIVNGYQTPEEIMNFIESWIVPKLGSFHNT